MTNPIAIAQKPAQPTGQPAGKIALGADPAPDFAGMIALGDAPPSAPARSIGAPAPTTAPVTATPSALSVDLAALLEKLVALAEKLDETNGLEDSDLENLETLLAGIESLLEEGVPLPLPDTEGFAALTELAASHGLAPAQGDAAATPFDTLAGLSARLAEGLREDAPGLAHRLDAHSAAIQTALADEQAIAATSVRHIESETKLNPAAAIADQSPEARPDKPAADAPIKDATPRSERSLVADTKPAEPQRPAAQASAPAASTAPVPAELDAPDGLVTGAPQPQTQATTGASAAMRPEAALYQRPDAQINLPHIAAEISRHVQNGVSRFEIRLNPAELGRIDVRMEVDASGNVVARLAVERSETLDLLQRDQRTLERALADAGLDSGRTELEFSLQQQGGNAHDEPEKSPWRTSVAVNAVAEVRNAPAKSDLDPYMRGYARLDAVNLWV